MKKRLFIFFLITLIIFGTIITVNSREESPKKVVIHFRDALNAGDFEATTNYFTDDIKSMPTMMRRIITCLTE